MKQFLLEPLYPVDDLELSSENGRFLSSMVTSGITTNLIAYGAMYWSIIQGTVKKNCVKNAVKVGPYWEIFIFLYIFVWQFLRTNEPDRDVCVLRKGHTA